MSREDRFVGRESERALLGAELEAALAGEGRLVLLVGEPGIGKTRTATALASEARERGASAAWGRCHEREGAPVYWPVVQALASFAGDSSGASAREIAEVLPLLRARETLAAADVPPERARFEKRSVSLANLFEAGPAEVLKYVALCNPASVESQGIAHPEAHLASFKIKPEAKHEKQAGSIATRFGETLLETRKPDRLLVPAAKGLEGPVEAPAEPAVDHFECYPVKVQKGEEKFPGAQVSVADQLAAARTFDLKKATRLCLAVDKNGEGILDPGAALLCYQAKPAKEQPKHEKREAVHVAHQFGPGLLDTVKEEELCVPASLGRPKATGRRP